MAKLDLHPPQRSRHHWGSQSLRLRQQSKVQLGTRLTMNIDYTEKIPNNVNLAEDRTLQRALERWQPGFLDWWRDMGPDGSSNFDVYLRTAVSVEPSGWAQFDYVKMPDYRWGIFLNPVDGGAKIN